MKISNLKRLADFLDTQYSGPLGTRVGWDGLLGLIPGIGSAITTVLSGIIVLQSIQLGAPTVIVSRMILNIFVDDLIGAIPLLGWIGDFFWKSNTKNVALLTAYLDSPVPVTRNTKLLLGVLAILALITIIGFVLAVGLAIYSVLFMITR